MKNKIYWIDNDYPFEISNTLEDPKETFFKTALSNATRIGASVIKAEIHQRQKMILFLKSNNHYQGARILSKSYVKTYQDELDLLIESFPEELI